MVTRDFNVIYGYNISMFTYTNDMKFIVKNQPYFFKIIMIFIYGSEIGMKYAYWWGIWLQLI